MTALLGIIILGGTILVYFYFLDGTVFNPVASELQGRVYTTTQPNYTVGDDVIVYSSKFCKYRAVPTTVYWILEDDVALSYPPKQSQFAKGCYDQDKIEIGVLPGYIGNHNYKFVGKVVYHLPARDVAVDLSTNEFYVSPKK